MDCEKFLSLLDAYVDNELSEAEKAQFLMHADTCENCKNELRNAEMLRSLLAEIDDDVAVPLQAQAAWRRAVREEAQKKAVRSKKRMWTRVAYAAAAVVLLIGCTFAVRGELLDKQQPDMVQLASVENDGQAQNEPAVRSVATADLGEPQAAAKAAAGGMNSADVASFAQRPDDCTAWKKFAAADYALACETIEALTAEYSGNCSREELDGEAFYTISMPSAYMAEFLNAASRIGAELESEVLEAAGETANVCILICKAA